MHTVKCNWHNSDQGRIWPQKATSGEFPTVFSQYSPSIFIAPSCNLQQTIDIFHRASQFKPDGEGRCIPEN